MWVRIGNRPAALNPIASGNHPYMPEIIRALLGATWFGYLARIVFTFMFWGSGLSKLFDFTGAQAEMVHFGLHPPAAYAAATLIVQLVGSALIISGRLAWLGAGMLAVFTALTIPIAHTFWTMEEPMRTVEFHVVGEHITVIGALMLVAILSHHTEAARPA